MALSFAGFEASKIHEGPWAEFNHLDSDMARLGMAVTAGSGDPTPRNWVVAAGTSRVKGIFTQVTGTEQASSTANTSGNPRIDLLVLRHDWSAKTVTLQVRAGTPAGSPTVPAIPPSHRQVGVMWDEPLAEGRVNNGAGVVSAVQVHEAPPSTAYGWRPIGSGMVTGVEATFIPTSVGVHSRMRLTLRGSLSGSSQSTLSLRINGDTTTNLHRRSLQIKRLGTNQVIDTDEGDGTLWRIARWGGTLSNFAHVELVMTHVSSNVGMTSNAYQAGSDVALRRQTEAYGDLSAARLVSSLRVGSGTTGVNFVPLRWWLEGYLDPSGT